MSRVRRLRGRLPPGIAPRFMSVLVTGGAGFIGSHVVDRFVANGQPVVVLDNLDPQVHGPGASPPPWLLRHVDTGAVTFIHGDIRDRATVDGALEGMDTIVHLAAAVGVGQSMYEPDYYTSVNDHGQGVILAAVAADPDRFRRFVVASSMSIYGEGAYRCATHGPVHPEIRSADMLEAGTWDPACPECDGPLQPTLTPESKPTQVTSVYAITKKSQEDLALCVGQAYGIPTYALRFFNTYGSRQALSNPYTGVAAIFLGRLKNGSPPLIFEDGAQTRDFIHVFDVADSIVHAAGVDADAVPSGAYNVCTGRPISVSDVARTVAERLGADIEPEVVGRSRTGDIRHCVGDPTFAREQLGFEAQVSLADGMDELIAWAQDAPADDRVEDSFRVLEERGLVR